MNGSQTGKFRDPALVDFGTDGTGPGRRLERLGGVLVDRPAPGTTALRKRPGLWQDAAAVFRDEPAGRRADGRGEWDFRGPIPEPWQIAVPLESSTLLLEVHPAPSGQLGVFLEQAGQWRWLHRAIRPGMAILSLFAHSGAASLAAAAAGADVVHVDASRQAIALARRNADASGCRDLPISWICEDAATFVTRCLRRGRRFAGIVLDPPSWGHGPKGQAFAIDRDLPLLLGDIARLLDPATRGPVLLTSHSSGWHPPRLRETLERALAGADPGSAGGVESGPLDLLDDTGRPLTLGGFARRDSAA